MRDARFGLPLSLVEALRVDQSPLAAELADLLAEPDGPAPRVSKPVRPRRSVGFGLALMLGASLAIAGQAAAATLEGRWTMRREASSFQERVTGPAPDAAVMVVTHDDADRFAYELIETRRGTEAARAAYDVSFSGAPSTSRAAGAEVGVTAMRDGGGDVLVRGPRVGTYRALIRVRRTSDDTATLVHAVEGPAGEVTLETLSLVRGDPATPDGVAGPVARGYRLAEAAAFDRRLRP